MSNFFAALDDSDTEGRGPAPVAKKTKAPKKEVVEPSKVEKRPVKNDRHTSDRHNPKGGRGDRAPARDGKRAYDRRSGTGRGKEIKKGGGGGRNWGSDQNDAKKAEGPVTEGKEDANTPEEKDAGKEAAAVVVKEDVVVEEPEPEDNTISYEEYLANKAKPDSVAFKALESRDIENEFAGKSSSKKVSEDFLKMGNDKALRKKGSGKNEKETLLVDFKIKSAIAGGDDRGGGRDRGEGGRGGGRGGGDRGRREGGRGGGGDRGGRGGGDRGRREGGRGGGGDRNRGGDRGSNRGGGGARAGGKGLDTTDASAFPSL